MKLLYALCLCMLACTAQAQLFSVTHVFNRVLSLPEHGSYYHLDEEPGAGVAWLRLPAFRTGTVSFEVKGKDVLQQSFVGMAFHGSNDTTYDVIYLRPFNFRAADPVRRSHAVQYISLPRYDWELLRNRFPGKYENAIEPAPDPNGWVKVKVVVTTKQVTVFVANKQCLQVDLLDNINAGTQLGLWVGYGSGGDWRNVKVL